jgi:hypothetical protein
MIHGRAVAGLRDPVIRIIAPTVGFTLFLPYGTAITA